MDFTLNEELLAMKEAARDFAQKEIVPNADKWDEEHYFPIEVVRKMGELGYYGCPIPEEYGGIDIGHLAQSIITEEIARGSSSLRVSFNTQCLGTAFSILRHGTEEQKKEWIPDLITAKKLGCFAITEPDSGSDVMSMKSTAKPDGDGFILNGCKTWISGVPNADVAIVYAYHDREQGSKGLSAFVVDLHLEGVSMAGLDKLGTRSMPTGEISFDNVRLPGTALLGKLGSGVKICFSSLNQTRLSCAAGGVGLAQACLDTAVRYCNEREQFGELVGKFQMNQELVANMAAEIEAARLLTYRAAWQKDQGDLGNVLETCYAKFFTGETVTRCAHSTMKILGAYGYSTEYPAARFYRDAVVYQIVEGTVNVQKMIIAQDQLGYRKANR
ncbi:MAG: acyl-CoA dehydrogenase [Candidatus Aminicenantes bacterium]|nr:acyl-CoA dehydrogenase [Candidatus Aminicenantes bacterium]NIM81322.1 acyl-CoA dehydrogenase [Candidatus Aminicenantes bacterium]NIN20732.1 acyl-CoA dehydrogenase [Candidatus Aminicenantes bacterium]NIN44510.1 acyl-CoA dehydrogenase [Candidatus Aminicenantes bacterium]NIN87330.1 acyl-CoA dehydrogenase [Candidatus Aminicenantes bacterium]